MSKLKKEVSYTKEEVVNYTVKIPKIIYDKIKKLAYEEDRSIASIIRQCLKKEFGDEIKKLLEEINSHKGFRYEK